jgi:hypothetical protein
MFSFDSIPVILSYRLFGFYIKIHWVLKGPECTFGGFVTGSRGLSLDEMPPASREEFRVSLGVETGSL